MRLYDYQDEGAHFLAARDRAYLADVPGLGKTAQVIEAAGMLNLKRVFVACPAVAVPVWEEEWDKWGATAHLHAMSYTKMARGGYLRDMYPNAVVLDEAHYAKNPDAKRTDAALSYAQQAPRAWLVSGSPMPNDPRELFAPFSYLWPDRIPDQAWSYGAWTDYFCEGFTVDYGWGRKGFKVTGVRNGRVLRSMLDGIMLRRHVRDVCLELPPLNLYTVPLPANPTFAAELERMGDLETATGRRVLGEHKAPRIAKLLVSEINDDRAYRAVVVMYHHKATGALLRRIFEEAGIQVWGFDGSTPQQARAEQVRQFQQSGERRAFVVQQMAGGTAITLTAASEIVLVEPDWSPEVNAQAIKRVHRISQTEPVRARIFTVADSLDQAIMANLATKIRMREEILGG